MYCKMHGAEDMTRINNVLHFMLKLIEAVDDFSFAVAVLTVE